MKATWFKISLITVLALSLGCSNDNDASNDSEDADGNDSNDNANGTNGQQGSNSGTTSGTTGSTSFPGGGESGSADPLVPGIGPETADECGSGTPADSSVVTVIDQDLECFYGGETTIPAAFIEQVVEVVDDKEWVHLRLTLSPYFVDNSYGENAIGWEKEENPDAKKKPKSGHTFNDLVGSDHAEILMYDKAGNVAVHFKLDYISEDPNSPSGYGTLGVLGGEGKMIVGDASWIMGAATSLDRNLNACELSEYLENSPATDKNYSLPEGAEAWDYRMVYEVWVDAEAFGSSGFDKAIIENVHASPSKADSNTITVTPGDCPCDPSKEICDPWVTDTDDPPGTDDSDKPGTDDGPNDTDPGNNDTDPGNNDTDPDPNDSDSQDTTGPIV